MVCVTHTNEKNISELYVQMKRTHPSSDQSFYLAEHHEACLNALNDSFFFLYHSLLRDLIIFLQTSEMIRLSNTQYFHFLQQADALRRTGSLCDAIISVKTQTFRAHRLVLACASRRLARHLTLGDSDGPVHCTLEYFSPHTFQQVLDFTYMQTLEVSEEDLLLLLRAAQLLEMQLLEDQCQKQLNMLHSRISKENKTGEIIYIKEEEEHPEQTIQTLKGRLVQDEKQGESVNEALNSITVEDDLPSSKTPNSPESTRKKPRLSPGSATPYSRDSVITRSTSSSTSSSSPWTVPNMLKSVSTLRQLAENYSSMVPVHPSRPPNQLPLPYPFPFNPPHMFPLLGSHFQSAAKACSDFHYGCLSSLYAGSTEIGNINKQGLLRRKKNCQRAFQTTKSR